MPDKPAPDLDALLRYRQKRDFAKTPEPPAGMSDGAEPDLTFVVQQHAATRMHWDFRLEVDGVLVSWAVPRGPSLDPKEKRMAAHVEDHPFDYGAFEGVIPKGNYGAGQVIVWDNGTYSPDEGGQYSWGDREEGSARMLAGIEAGKLSFTLRGTKLRGSWTLVRTARDPKDWLLIKHRDAYASVRDVLEEDQSVLSSVTIGDLKEGRMPRMPTAGRGRIRMRRRPRCRTRRSYARCSRRRSRSRSHVRAGSSNRSSTACAHWRSCRDRRRARGARRPAEPARQCHERAVP